MDQLANPGSLVISEYTRKLTEGYFDLKALGAAEIKGVDEPLNVYDVIRAGLLRTRLQVSGRRDLTRFVGRHSDMEQLQQALEQAQEGHGQIVGVMGEPRLGKSRLFYEFKLTSQSDCLVLEAFAVAHGKSSPYLPLIELLKAHFEIEPSDDERKRREKVNGKVLTLDRSLEDSAPYLFSLLAIEDPDSSLQQMDAQIRRTRTFEALKKLFLRESLNQPLILIVEDLHWIDSETQGFLDTLSDSVASAQVLLLVNYRPEYRHEWSGKTFYTQLRLVPLGKKEAEEFLTFLLGSDPSLTALKPLILEKTDGTPFFMEEVVQTLVEEGALSGEHGHYHLETTPSDLQISPTAQGVLAARIDRLTSEEKALLQQLSVIGRQFPVSLVKEVVTQAEDAIYRVLASLLAKEFLYEQPAFPESEYLFKHALTQDVAYGTVLQEQRKALHERTGQAMEVLYQDSLDDHYSALAHHYQFSENLEKAVEYLTLAGRQALQRSANTDAISSLSTAIHLLQSLPTTPERMSSELRLQTTLRSLLIMTHGSTIPVEATYTRARALCESMGETPQIFQTLWGLWAFYWRRADLSQARELADQLLQLADDHTDSARSLQAHLTVGTTQYYFGDFVASREHAEQGLEIYEPEQHRSEMFTHGQEPGVMCLCRLTWANMHLSYLDQALTNAQEAIALAREAAHPFTLGTSLFALTFVHQYRRERVASQRHIEEASELSAEHGFAYMQGMATFAQGWVVFMEGNDEDGLETMRRSADTTAARGTWIARPWLLSFLAEAHGDAGHVTQGLQIFNDGFEHSNKTREHWCNAELHRLKGELTLQHSQDTAEAEACFQKSIEIAQKQGAKSWELRTATSLARPWQGKTEEARDLLAPVYNWFTEGFDTADLKEAKVLLDELASG